MEWAAQSLSLPSSPALPSHRPLYGALAGFAGILLLAGPFLREACGKSGGEERGATEGSIGIPRIFLEFFAGSLLMVFVLMLGIPLKAVRLFQGDYLTSFLLLLGALLVAWHWTFVRKELANSPRKILGAAFAGIVLLVLLSAWFDLTFSDAWLTDAKWARFPFLAMALFPYLLAEETLLGSVDRGKRGRRLALALTFRLISWGALMAGVLVLHNGEILMGLLSIYLGLFNLLQRSAMDIVRNETGSATATAIFGAILLAGFCLVIFPLT
jgi:hypothetical protein